MCKLNGAIVLMLGFFFHPEICLWSEGGVRFMLVFTGHVS